MEAPAWRHLHGGTSVEASAWRYQGGGTNVQMPKQLQRSRYIAQKHSEYIQMPKYKFPIKMPKKLQRLRYIAQQHSEYIQRYQQHSGQC